jgi:hypothetical protein
MSHYISRFDPQLPEKGFPPDGDDRASINGRSAGIIAKKLM